MAKVMKFRVKRGVHSENGELFRSGVNDVFQSETDWVKLGGAEKFERLPSTAEISEGTSVDNERKVNPALQEEGTATEDKGSEELKVTAEAKAAGKKIDEDADPDEEDEEEEVEEGSLGADVSDQFESAKEADLMVFKKGKEYFVTESDSTDKAINDKHLKNKKDVEKFIASQKK